MIEELDRDQILRILAETRPGNALPRYEEKDRWERFLANPMIGASRESCIDAAEASLREPLALVPASLYLAYRRTGSRPPHDRIVAARRGRLQSMVLGECIERKGRFLDPVMDTVWAICEESSWVIPAHTPSTLPVYKGIKWVDLVAANTALVLGQTLQMLGSPLDQHDPMIGERILDEIDRRVWRPYSEPENLGWLRAKPGGHVNNWNAVCNCGVIGSALLCLQDTQRLATMIETCLASLNDYLHSFDPDGGSSEGPSYWSYGVSHYAWLAYLLETRTEGRISPMDAPEMRGIALFPQKVTLSARNVVNFSDCAAQVHFPTSLMYYLGDRLELPQVRSFADYLHELDAPRRPFVSAWDIAWMPERPCGKTWRPNPHEYLSGQQWMVSRTDPEDPGCLMVAAKGGHNGENHNQNDLGNFLVHFGGETLIVDLGSGSYTREYFGAGRYGILVNSSWGHNVPLVNGCQQSAGSGYAARVLGHSSSSLQDCLDLELAGAYPVEAGLQSLRRTVTLVREPSTVRVVDAIVLKEREGSCKCPLYTVGNIERRDGGLRFAGKRAVLRVDFGPPGVACEIEEVDLHDERFPGPVRRAILSLPVRESRGQLLLTITGCPRD